MVNILNEGRGEFYSSVMYLECHEINSDSLNEAFVTKPNSFWRSELAIGTEPLAVRGYWCRGTEVNNPMVEHTSVLCNFQITQNSDF